MVRTWDAFTGEPVTTLSGHHDSVCAVGIGRAGNQDVVISGSHDGTVRIRDAITGEHIGTLTVHDEVHSLAIGQAGERDVIVSGFDDGRVRIWDAVTRELVGVLVGHEGPVRSVAIGRAGDRDIIVSGSDDRTVRIWDAVSVRLPVQCWPTMSIGRVQYRSGGPETET